MPRDDTEHTEFMAALSHDVRTPLTVISLRVQLLTRALDRGQEIGPERLRHDLDAISAQVEAITQALGDTQRPP